VATTGVIFAAFYMLPMVQKIFFNALEKPESREMKDLSGREIAILAPMCALMIWIGWNPTPFLSRMELSVQAVIERVEAAAPQTAVTAVQPMPSNDDAGDDEVAGDDE